MITKRNANVELGT